MEKCIECKTEVVHYYRSLFCKDCIKDFFDTTKDENEEVFQKEEDTAR